MRLFDAHNHLQDTRFGGRQAELVSEARETGLVRMVVNGSCEEDWPDVGRLATEFSEMLPAFGLHPWHVHARTTGWQAQLIAHLDAVPGAVIGEIGIDRWITEQPPHIRARYVPEPACLAPASLAEQELAFVWQLRLAAGRDLPASIHCLQAWGRLLELLRTNPVPSCGFLLHSYGGPAEMLPALTKLGAYFGFPGYFLHERKARQREVFRAVPPERLLVETDAPDQLPPPEARTHFFTGDGGAEWNHPANLRAIYAGLAALRGQPVETLADIVAENFERLFGKNDSGNRKMPTHR